MRITKVLDQETDQAIVGDEVLKTPVLSGSIYRVKVSLQLSPENVSIQSKLGIEVPSLGSLQAANGCYIYLSGVSSVSGGVPSIDVNTSGNLTMHTMPESELGMVFTGETNVRIGATGGELIVKFQSATNGENVRMLPGSFIDIEKIV